VALTTHLHLMPRLKKEKSYTSTLLWAFLACSKVKFNFTYLLTHSMEQSPCWEANRFSASQEIPAFYGTRKFITPEDPS
jgi:hypothetical protein